MFIIASLVSYWLSNYGMAASLFVSVSQTPFFSILPILIEEEKEIMDCVVSTGVE